VLVGFIDRFQGCEEVNYSLKLALSGKWFPQLVCRVPGKLAGISEPSVLSMIEDVAEADFIKS
jgi:hypothetical protein